MTATSPLLDTSAVSSGAELRQPHGRRAADVLEHADHADALRGRREPVHQPEPGLAGLRRRHDQAAGAAFGGVGSNTYSIDGATNSGSGRRIAASPNSDMIQEMRVESSNFDASVGHGVGLQISMVTRCGREPVSRHRQLPVLDEQDQRAQPKSAADVHARRKGALRDRALAQPRADRSAARS